MRNIAEKLYHPCPCVITDTMCVLARSLVLCVCFVDPCLSFNCSFLLAIVLSVLLQFMDSDYPFGIFKLFLKWVFDKI